MVGILLTLVHVAVALVLILVVLLQTGKRADLAGAFGGGGSQTAFGTRGAATLLSKLTTGAAILFMLTSLGLSLVSVQESGRRGSVLEEVQDSAETTPADVPTPADAPDSAPAADPLQGAAPAPDADDEPADVDPDGSSGESPAP